MTFLPQQLGWETEAEARQALTELEAGGGQAVLVGPKEADGVWALIDPDDTSLMLAESQYADHNPEDAATNRLCWVFVA